MNESRPSPLVRVARAAAPFVQALLVAAPVWLIYVAVSQPPRLDPPPIPGASAEEQAGPVIRKGFDLGRQFRVDLLYSHSESWRYAAKRFESGVSWDKVKAEWATSDREYRDRPFDRLVQPEIDRIIPPQSEPTPAQRREAGLFLKAFAYGLGDIRR